MAGAWSVEGNLVGDLVLEVDVVDREQDAGGDGPAAFERARLDGGAHGALDLTLRGDAHALQKFANGHVEDVFVHRCRSRSS